MIKINIYIVRHGQTDWNVEGRYAGRKNVPLNKKGILQANEIKERLKEIKFDKVYSSPLDRALKTTQIISKNNIIIDERIVERSNGKLEGKLKSEIVENIDFNDPNEIKYNIESITDFRTRIQKFLNDVVN